jgi:protein-S-isoprenylcysteine O-methyltransferase Ste14
MLLLRALFAFLACPGVVAGVIPAFIVAGRGVHQSTAIFGVIALIVGGILLLWCVRDFFVSGRGTLAPWDPPAHLVIVGLYRYVRNPMYLAVLVIVAGWSLLYGSLSLAGYALVLAVGFHLRVILHEEPWLRRNFGPEWECFSAAVRRWRPRLLKKSGR